MMTLTYNDMAVEVFRGGERSEEEQFAQRVYCRMLIRHMQRQSQTTPGFLRSGLDQYVRRHFGATSLLRERLDVLEGELKTA